MKLLLFMLWLDLPQGAQTISIRTTACEYASQQMPGRGSSSANDEPQLKQVLTSRTATEKTFLLYEKLGGGKARDLAVDKKNADLKFLPWYDNVTLDLSGFGSLIKGFLHAFYIR